MTRPVWRWEERDFGFRFRAGQGKQASEYYQAKSAGNFYVVPPSQRKLSAARIGELVPLIVAPTSPNVVVNPWRYYERSWDWIESEDGICLNYAGCLVQEEIDRREDEGVQRARELIAELVEQPQPVQLTSKLICQVHVKLMGTVYPFAGNWRTVELHKGSGPTKWPLPPSGIQPLIDVYERDVLSRSPIVSNNDDEVFQYASEVMNELLAIHPFREGNGRTAFIVADLILMQNDLLPLTTYERRTDEDRYFAACESGRIRKDYEPLAQLLAEWEDRAVVQWRATHEQ